MLNVENRSSIINRRTLIVIGVVCIFAITTPIVAYASTVHCDQFRINEWIIQTMALRWLALASIGYFMMRGLTQTDMIDYLLFLYILLEFMFGIYGTIIVLTFDPGNNYEYCNSNLYKMSYYSVIIFWMMSAFIVTCYLLNTCNIF